LIDYQARYYSPTLGRFISPDTIVPEPDNPQIWNRYTYVGNNPIRHTDPDGHCFPACTVAIGAVAGAAIGVSLYAANVASSGQDWNWSEAGTAIVGGAVAGGLIGTGVGMAAGVSALAVTGAGVGMASAGGGYMAANIVTEMNSSLLILQLPLV
jgi:uncharacterized protein RhaS with RHS repeats